VAAALAEQEDRRVSPLARQPRQLFDQLPLGGIRRRPTNSSSSEPSPSALEDGKYPPDQAGAWWLGTGMLGSGSGWVWASVGPILRSSSSTIS
jgi:hypothetical protein